LVRGFSKRIGQIDAELDRLAAEGRDRTVSAAVAGTQQGDAGGLIASLMTFWSTKRPLMLWS
jgi:hypothetical protein